MKIIADTATLFSPEEGKTEGITIIPVSVTIGDKSYKDFEEINTEEFLELVQAINDGKNNSHILEEASHVAVTAIRFIENML